LATLNFPGKQAHKGFQLFAEKKENFVVKKSETTKQKKIFFGPKSQFLLMCFIYKCLQEKIYFAVEKSTKSCLKKFFFQHENFDIRSLSQKIFFINL